MSGAWQGHGVGGLKLTVYLGDRDHVGGRLLAGAVMDVFASRRVAASALVRGVEGFGIKHRLHTERLLTLSEDLPLLAVAIDAPAAIEAALAELRTLPLHGLLTLERVRMPSRGAEAADETGASAQLTVVIGRRLRVDGVAAHLAAVACLQRHGLDGATALLGLDGTVSGERRRASFWGRNSEVPLLLVGNGEAALVAAAAQELSGMFAGAPMALERVQVCKREGELISPPRPPPQPMRSEHVYWQKLTVHTGEQARHAHEPLHAALVRRLRLAGAAGATTLRGLWGFQGAGRPHGERPWSLRRRTPLQTIVIDTPENVGSWFEVADELTAREGLVTCESVPALRSAGPLIEHGGLLLAAPAGT